MKKYILLLAVCFHTFVIFAQEDKPTEYPGFIGKELSKIEKNKNWRLK